MQFNIIKMVFDGKIIPNVHIFGLYVSLFPFWKMMFLLRGLVAGLFILPLQQFSDNNV